MRPIEPGHGIKNAPTYAENPYLEDAKLLELPKSKKLDLMQGKADLFNQATKEQIGQIDGFYNRKEVDATQFIKLYLEGTGALSKLTPSGLAVFQLLYVQLLNQIEKGQVIMTYSLATKGFSISKSIFIRGLTDLIAVDFVRKTDTTGVYWVNPRYIFNGNRLRFVQDYDRKETRREELKEIIANKKPLTLKGRADDPKQTHIEDDEFCAKEKTK